MTKQYYAELIIKEVVMNERGSDEVKLIDYFMTGPKTKINKVLTELWAKTQAVEIVLGNKGKE